MRALPLVLLAACGPARVPFTDDAACVRLATGSLRFEGARIGLPEERAIEVANACDRVIEVRPELSGSEAFTAPDWSEVPALGAVELQIAFTAEGYAPEAGTLGVAGLSVALDGLAAPDQDGDGHDATQAEGDDCDDADASVHAGAEEVRDLQDQDCDGVADDGLVRPGDIYVTELMVTPASGPRWLELTNASGYDVQLDGMRLDGTDGDELVLEPYVLAAGASVVIGGGAPNADIVWTGFDLAPTDALALSHGDVALQYVEWDESWGFEAGASLGLDPIVGTRANAGDARNWCPSVTAMADGDRGTPRAPNDACAQLDHDGDAWSAEEGDCDDAVAAVNPDAIEVWNDRDDDCDGTVDHAVIGDVAGGFTDGGLEDYLRIGGAGDLDSDGEAEIVLFATTSGGAWLLEGPTALGASGNVASHARAVISASRVTWGAASPHWAHVVGDVGTDLVLTGSDETSGWLAVFTDEAALIGNVDPGDAALRVTGWASTLRTDLDLDGDGVAEVVVGNTSVDTDGVEPWYEGSVDVLSLESTTGDVSAADVRAARWTGDSWYELAGSALAGGDVDGDGVLDLVVGAAESVESSGDVPGTCAVVSSATHATDGLLDEAAVAHIAGTADQHLCSGLEVADVDGDEVADVIAGANDGVYVFLGGAGLEGTLSSADAAFVLPVPAASWGTPLATGDVDGDGAADILVGAGREYTLGSGDSISLHLGRDLRAGITEPRRAATSGSPSSYFGSGLLVADLNGDRLEDLLLGAPEHASRSGRVYFVESE